MRTLLRDTGTVFRRSMRISLRNPAWLAIMMMQPILYIVLFGPLLEPLAGQLGTGNAYQIFVPGILVQLGIFGSLFVGFGLIAEYRAGVIESQRVTRPAGRRSCWDGCCATSSSCWCRARCWCSSPSRSDCGPRSSGWC
jgi:ABC-2 type transport system permease protein